MSDSIAKLVETASDLTIESIKKAVESAKYRPVSEYDVAYNDGIKTAIRLIEIFQMEMKLRQGDHHE